MKTIDDLTAPIRALGTLAKRAYWRSVARRNETGTFPGSATYWEQRYAPGQDSGVGSYGAFAEFKAEVINTFVEKHRVQSVMEFGCGDGNQLRLARYPAYVGFDVSSTAVGKCRDAFRSDAGKSFRLMSEYRSEKADLVLSLDVIFHLVEDDVFERYMATLFASAERYVIVYSSDTDDNSGYAGTPVRHRQFTKWIRENMPCWRLMEHVPNRFPYRGDYRTGSFAEFFIYRKEPSSTSSAANE